MLTAWDRCPPYEVVWLLTMPAGEQNARGLAKELEQRGSRVELCVLPVSDPTDHGQLFAALRPVLSRIEADAPSPGWQRDVLLSAGTPQTQTLWIILVQAGLLGARMLQVIPEAFVPQPHASPVREVRLEIEGFPEIRALRDEVKRLRATVQWRGQPIVGASAAMQRLQQRATRVAASDLPVLIVGETGTGKELVARALHAASERARGPFVAESCAAFAEGLLPSELFGHEAGAFTGATGRKRGLFELAHGGTLFLDEVGDMPLGLQAQLLRVLQEGQLRRVGGETLLRVDVRLLAATHRDLVRWVREGKFREDLYYRLRGVTLELPPLRDRRDDIPLLIEHFLQEKPAAKLELSRAALNLVINYRWPGNVRDLRAEVSRWKVFCRRRVEVEDLSSEIAGVASEPAAAATEQPLNLAAAVQRTEEGLIRRAFEEHAGNLSRTARSLGVDRNTLKRKLAALGIRGPIGVR